MVLSFDSIIEMTPEQRSEFYSQIGAKNDDEFLIEIYGMENKKEKIQDIAFQI